jgi:hypothetical protein
MAKEEPQLNKNSPGLSDEKEYVRVSGSLTAQ